VITGRRTQVAVVGGGPAGAVVATLLARAGREVALFERALVPVWRAGGVFTSPATMAALRRIGVEETLLAALARPIPGLRVETPRGTSFRLTYGDDGSLAAPAVGLDRPAFDAALLAMAEQAGVDVRMGVTVRRVSVGGERTQLAIQTGTMTATVEANVVIGADGLRSVVARSAGVVRRAPLGPRVGLTFHLRDPEPDVLRDGRMCVLDGAYCGLAPVAGGRINVGIVLASPSWRRELSERGAAAVATHVVAAVPVAADEPRGWRDGELSDYIAGAAPLAHRVSRRSGDGWLLIGDAAGFLDPFTGEGLHRALVSAELAAASVDAHLRGQGGALHRYDRAMSARFATKDIVSRVVTAFLDHPAAFEHVAARLARRAAVRETMGLVMGDLVAASRALDPRFLAALLAP
jgi:flavin-dependent dehydrogenase